VRNMSASTLAIYGAEEVISVDQAWGGAIGWRVSSPLSMLGHVWAAPNLDGRWDIIALNLNQDAKNVTVLFSDLGLPEHQSASVRDLWEKKDLGVFTGRFVTQDLPQHGSMMLAVTPHRAA
jgi:alpha-galactosidase